MRPASTPRSAIKLTALAAGIIILSLIGYVRFHSISSAKTDSAASETPQSKTDSSQHAPAQAARASKHTDAQLQQIITSWEEQQPFDATIVVQEINGNLRGASHSADKPMTTASTYKIFVAYAILHQIEQGKYTMSTKVRSGQTVSDALSNMILNSDNNSAEALGFRVGWDTVNSLAASAGAVHTDINNYDASGNPMNGTKQSTATDLNLMLTKLEDDKLLDAGNTNLLLGLMKSQHYRERIPTGVPSGIAVADKPGWLANVQNDAAIVYGTKSTYTLVIMTNGSTTRPLADLSQRIYQYLES
jgi:beta-lactamase class A